MQQLLFPSKFERAPKNDCTSTRGNYYFGQWKWSKERSPKKCISCYKVLVVGKLSYNGIDTNVIFIDFLAKKNKKFLAKLDSMAKFNLFMRRLNLCVKS